MSTQQYLAQATDALVHSPDLSTSLEGILDALHQALSATAVTVLAYDPTSTAFLNDYSHSVGVPTTLDTALQDGGLRLADFGHIVMEREWVEIGDTPTVSTDVKLTESLHGIARRLYSQGFLGMALHRAGHKLGALLVIFDQPHAFSDQERQIARTLANLAAAALHRRYLEDALRDTRLGGVPLTQFLEGVRRADLPATLQDLVQQTRAELGWDSVTIYEYDQDRGVFKAPVLVGVRYRERVQGPDDIAEGSIPMWALQKDKIQFVSRVADHERLQHSRFACDEQIESLFAGPLRLGPEERLGVMFVNYRTPPTSIEVKRRLVELLATRVLHTILLARRDEINQKRAASQQALFETAFQIAQADAPDLPTVLGLIARRAWELTSAPDNAVSYCHIALNEGETMPVRAAWPPEQVGNITYKLGPDVKRWHKDQGKIGIIGLTLQTGLSQRVGDVRKKEYKEYYVELDEATCSELAVPIKIDNQVRGVINVEDSALYAFDEQDQRNVEALAVLAAIAIRQHESHKRQAETVQALSRTAKIATSYSFNREQILQYIADEAFKLTSVGKRQPVSFTLISLRQHGVRRLVAASPREERRQVEEELGPVVDRWPVTTTEKRPGIIGRAIRTKQPQRVADVTGDPDYAEYRYDTRSELAVPIISNDEVKGVINIEHTDVDAFTEEDERNVVALAAHAAIAIRTAEEKDERAAAEAVAMMDLASKTWLHDIRSRAGNIRDGLGLALADVRDGEYGGVPNRLSTLVQQAEELLRVPNVPSLRSEEGREAINIVDLLGQRQEQFWRKERYKSVEYVPDFEMDGVIMVKAHRWALRHIVDSLMENALDAMEDVALKRLTIRVTEEAKAPEVLINFIDTGKGIPPQIVPKLFREVISSKEAGRGIALILARMIVREYGGDLEVEDTSSSGTTIRLRLPLQEVSTAAGVQT